MTPSSRLAASLLASIVLGWPALEACLAGALAVDVVMVRWAAGFFVAWIALGILGRLVDAYRTEPEAPGADGSGERRHDLADAAPDVVRQRRVEDGPLNAS